MKIDEAINKNVQLFTEDRAETQDLPKLTVENAQILPVAKPVKAEEELFDIPGFEHAEEKQTPVNIAEFLPASSQAGEEREVFSLEKFSVKNSSEQESFFAEKMEYPAITADAKEMPPKSIDVYSSRAVRIKRLAPQSI